MTNKIRTARYNFFTFFPIALLIQYTKLGNVFWTIQCILQFSNETIRTQNPYLVGMLVLSILTVGILKEWMSDHKRSVADNQVNKGLNRRVVRVTTAKKSEDALSEARRQGSLKTKGMDANRETVTFNYHSEEVFCQDIKVGDLLILKDNMVLPADCVLIKVPSGDSGECQIQTGQLDGERSLKPRYSLP